MMTRAHLEAMQSDVERARTRITSFRSSRGFAESTVDPIEATVYLNAKTLEILVELVQAGFESA